MFELSFIFWFCVSLIFSFPLFKNPISLAAMVVVISLSFVGLISLISSFWFSYILFLVYVGGLLVLFIYICLVSSNYPFNLNINGLICSILGALLVSLSSEKSVTYGFLGGNTWLNGEELMSMSNISIFLFLVILLLMMLLVVVRVSGAGSFIVGSEEG